MNFIMLAVRHGVDFLLPILLAVNFGMGLYAIRENKPPWCVAVSFFVVGLLFDVLFDVLLDK